MPSPVLNRLFDLKGQVAVVTDSGALSSVDVAPMLAEAGATVVVADLDLQKTQALVAGILDAGGQAIAMPTDIESETGVRALFDAVRDRLGRLDILVNCAGINANQPLLDTTLAQFDDLHSVNLRSTFLLMRESVRLMLEGGRGGRIVNVTTIGSLRAVLHGNAAYGATRTGVTGLTRSIAYDHAKDGIMANLVLPGVIPGKTRFHDTTQARLAAGGTLSGSGMDAERRLPQGMGNGADIAAAVLFFVSPAARYITGQALAVDGGYLLT
ncbi:MAG: SDR family oxidoreductase [Burkholderiaceae bacterium]